MMAIDTRAPSLTFRVLLVCVAVSCASNGAPARSGSGGSGMVPSGGGGGGGSTSAPARGGQSGSGGAASGGRGGSAAPDTGGTGVPGDASTEAPAQAPDSAPVVGTDDLPACKRDIPVSTSAALTTAIGAAQPGDCITLADGDYVFPVITAKGTEAAPIVIRAANVLKAVVASGDLKMQGAAYVVVRGISWTSNGTIWMTDTDHGRISRFRIQCTESGPQQAFHDLAWITVFGASQHCRIDHCDLGPQNQRGNMILVTGTEEAPLAMAQHTRIDHNFFHDVHYGGGNGWETIRSGADTYSFTSSFTVIEHNLFKNDANDPEVVSLKSSDNTLRYNTLRASTGQFVLRHGNRDVVHGNYILADGNSKAMGLRVNGGQHKIFNNYVEGVSGPGIFLEGGNSTDNTGVLQDHKQVYKTEVVFNTVVNAGGIAVGGVHPMDPVDCTVAYNIVQGPGALYTLSGGTNNKFVGNIANLGTPQVKDGVTTADPKLMKVGTVFSIGAGSPAINAGMPSYPYVMDDIQGKARKDGMPDVGANEVSDETAHFAPLTETDVGPRGP
jgi:hypothetical protein